MCLYLLDLLAEGAGVACEVGQVDSAQSAHEQALLGLVRSTDLSGELERNGFVRADVRAEGLAVHLDVSEVVLDKDVVVRASR